MNIFLLDKDMIKASRYHLDKHCVKMILEHCQMLCTSLYLNPELKKQLKIEHIPYKPVHEKHPCTIWVSKSYNNFAWLVAYTHYLHEEFKYRYHNLHSSYITLKNANMINAEIISYGSKLDIENLSPALAMPDYCKLDSPIESYRKYYNMEKRHLFSWTKRKKPRWIESKIEKLNTI